MIPQEFLDELLARIDIVELIGRYLRLKRSGANYFAVCPFHEEKTASFSVSPARQFYHCFGCGAHGTAITFLMRYLGLSFREAVERLAVEAGVALPQANSHEAQQEAKKRSERAALLQCLEKAARFYEQRLYKSRDALSYLQARGIRPEAIERFRLGYAPSERQALALIFPHYRSDPLLVSAGLVIEKEGQRFDRFRQRITFPITDRQGQVIAFGARLITAGEPKYLNSPETPLFEKGRELFGLALAREAIRRKGAALLVEGYLDVIQLWQHGFDNAVAVLGTAASSHQLRTLWNHADELICAFDGDQAGKRAAWRALEHALEVLRDTHRMRFLFLPEGEDPDSFLRRRGAEAFAGLIAQAVPLSRWLIESLCAEADLSSAEGRARLVHAARPLLAKIKHAPTLCRILKEELAAAVRLSLEAFDQAPLEALKPLPARKPPAQEAAIKPFYKALQQESAGRLPVAISRTATLARILLARPRLAAQVPAGLLRGETPDEKIALRLIDAIEHDAISPDADLEAIARYFHNDEQLYHRVREHVAAIRSQLLPYLENPEKELTALIERLQRAEEWREFHELIRLKEQKSLSPYEELRLVRLYQKLVQEKKMSEML